jgi:hypothetical protein
MHLANLLYLAAYLVKDILWLRVVTSLAGLCLLVMLSTQPTPAWAAIAWNLLFVVINTVQIHLLLLERRPIALHPDEQRLHQLVFRSLRPRELRRLVAVGELRAHGGGERLVASGEPLDRLMLIVDGQARVRVGERDLASLGAGKFIGEMSWLTGQPPSAEVLAEPGLRVASWDARKLREHLEHHPEVRVALQQVMGADLAHKLRSERSAADASAGALG